MPLLSALAALALTAVPASAEWALELLAGGAFSRAQDVGDKFAGTKFEFKDVNFKNSFSIGGRVGYWFESLPYLGMALDVSHFRAEIDKQTVVVCSGFCVGGLPVAHLDFKITGVA